MSINWNDTLTLLKVAKLAAEWPQLKSIAAVASVALQQTAAAAQKELDAKAKAEAEAKADAEDKAAKAKAKEEADAQADTNKKGK